MVLLNICKAKSSSILKPLWLFFAAMIQTNLKNKNERRIRRVLV